MAQPDRPTVIDARALIQRGVDQYLILQVAPADAAGGRLWEFPGGATVGQEVPEPALRRICRGLLGVELAFQLGQPPFSHDFGDRVVVYRYCVCSIAKGEPRLTTPGEMRWVGVQQLREYDFDAPTQGVVRWLIEGN